MTHVDLSLGGINFLIQALNVDLKVSKDVDVSIKHLRVKENGTRTSPSLLT